MNPVFSSCSFQRHYIFSLESISKKGLPALTTATVDNTIHRMNKTFGTDKAKLNVCDGVEFAFELFDLMVVGVVGCLSGFQEESGLNGLILVNEDNLKTQLRDT